MISPGDSISNSLNQLFQTAEVHAAIDLKLGVLDKTYLWNQYR